MMTMMMMNYLSAKKDACDTSAGYAMLMRPNKAETALHGYHCQSDMAVRMRELYSRSVTIAFRWFITNDDNDDDGGGGGDGGGTVVVVIVLW